jgi:glutamine cyclotransferase
MPDARSCRVALIAALCALGCQYGRADADASGTSPRYPEVVASHRHDSRIFTQGLAVDGSTLYESSGLQGRSMLLMGAPGRPAAERSYHFPDAYFAEGLAVVGDEIMVLTWRAEKLFVFDRHSLQLKRKLGYRGEGWGLTYDGTHLLLSDGSDRINRLDPRTLESAGHIRVRDARGAVDKLNELDWDGATLYANVWQSNRLLAIDPDSGQVLAEWDLTPLAPRYTPFGRDGVANGVAFDRGSGHFWITGKGWPTLYEVRLQAPALAARRSQGR